MGQAKAVATNRMKAIQTGAAFIDRVISSMDCLRESYFDNRVAVGFNSRGRRPRNSWQNEPDPERVESISAKQFDPLRVDDCVLT